MIQDSDDKVIFEVSRTHMRREVARLIYDFFTGAGKINALDRSFNSDNHISEMMMRFSIKSINRRSYTKYVYDNMCGYPVYVNANIVNEYMEKGLKWISEHLPEPLYMKYEYTTYEADGETRMRGLRESTVIRSGYNVEIMDPEKVDHEFWDGSYASSHDFYVKFKVLGERLSIKSDRYEDELTARFSGLDNNEDVRNVVEEIVRLREYENRPHTYVV